KPGFDKNLGALAHFRHELIAKIRALRPEPAAGQAGPRGAVKASTVGVQHAAQAVARLRRVARRSLMPRVLMVGASTGGPQAVNALLKGLQPLVAHIPVVIVQHMPALFTSVFAEHLVRLTGLACHEAQDGDVLRPGFVYVAPGGHHTLLVREGEHTVLRVNSDPPVRFARPSIDWLIESGAAALGARAWCVLLTGMGQDGLIGARAVAAAGGKIFAQDEASSVVWGMPGAVTRAGLADETGDPAALAEKIIAFTGDCLP
ncbi:MAG: CheB methylesterase domain-containing protein, partial [Beijerinckiaceae bacterium]